MSKIANDVIIVTSSLTKDMTGKEDQFRASAIKALCTITDVRKLSIHCTLWTTTYCPFEYKNWLLYMYITVMAGLQYDAGCYVGSVIFHRSVSVANKAKDK